MCLKWEAFQNVSTVRHQERKPRVWERRGCSFHSNRGRRGRKDGAWSWRSTSCAKATVWNLAIMRTTAWQKILTRVTILKKIESQRKGHCLRPNTGNKGVKQNVPAKRRRDGQWTSSPSTPHESVHCVALNARAELPVNQSSQLPSTTSRHGASRAQDRWHVTVRLTQPPPLYRHRLATQGWDIPEK